jgi:DNA polymerase-3 subunit beta
MLQVEVSKKRLQPLVKAANTIAQPSDSRPILRNLLLTATQDGLEITATDMTISLWLFLPVGDGLAVLGEGKVVVPAYDLMQIIGSIKTNDLRFRDTGSNCLITAGGSRFTTLVEDSRDFPNIHRFSSRKPFVRIKGALLQQMVDRSAYCAHNERSFYLMHGLLVKAESGQLHMAATNGQRLGVCLGKFSECSSSDEDFSAEIVVPADLAIGLKKVVGDPEELVDIQWMARALNVRGSLGEVSLLALNGSFPDYTRGIPSNSKIIEFDRKKLIEVFAQTQVFKAAITALVLMTLESDRLVLSTLVPDAGEAKIEHEHTWPHEPISLVVNPEFILQTARLMKSDRLSFELEDEMTQTLVREQRDDEVDSFCVYAVARR